MSPRISERAFETAIEDALLGRDEEIPRGETAVRDRPAPAWGKRKPEEYDRALCLVPRDLLDFVYATQPKEWRRLEEHHGAEVKEKFLQRVAREIERRGVLDVLRKGVRDSGCRFDLAYFPPASRLNEELQSRYRANVLSVVRQLKYSARTEQSIDLGLFLNGLPIFTAELKNPLTGQTVEDALRQYREDRDPREPLLAFRRCLAHFAVDPDWVYFTTRLAGPRTLFFPFNRGRFGGAGNPPVPPSGRGYPTSYLWEEVWAPESVLDLVQHFVQDIEAEDEKGRKTGERILLFPRYHQLDCVRRLVADARACGPGRRYLVQHSAGSGKSNSISWLAHRLSILHDAEDRRVFDSIVVVTDRRVLDRQLQRNVRQFQQVEGVVENIDQTSRQLKDALEGGKTIIVTTLQKFPVIAGQISGLPGKRFAVLIDEAHSSQSGETSRSMKAVLAAGSLEEAEAEEGGEEEDIEDRIAAEIRSRAMLPNVSYFAFTATPKPKTLELFGTEGPDGRPEPFSLYTMRQAIEEGFILDVLENYTTFKVYWRLLKKIEEDPRYDRRKASYLLRSFVDLHKHAIRKKVEIMVEHFHGQVAHRIGGRAKAMVVARSRLHAVRYRLEFDRYLKEKGYPYRALVAFSGTVKDGEAEYTEARMNSTPERRIGEAQTAEAFQEPAFRFLIVAEKFQTGFDQPLLHTMYVDKRLGGVAAVQTLSRLNRTHPEKKETMVLDFANDAEEIQRSFQPYYEKTILSERTDPNLLYDLQGRLLDFHVFAEEEVEAFARLFFAPGTAHERLYAALRPAVDRYKGLPDDERTDFRGVLTDFVRLYAFLSQILTFADAGLEKLYAYARLLRRYLPPEKGELPREVVQAIDMESYRIRETRKGRIPLERGEGVVEPVGPKGPQAPTPEEIEALSLIIRELNDRFGTEFTEEDRVFIRTLEERLAADEALAASVRVNAPENARLTFDLVVNDKLQDMVDTNFQFYKRVTDDPKFAKFFGDWLFERFRAARGEAGEPEKAVEAKK